MPYGDASVLPTTAPWPEPPSRLRPLRLLPLVFATLLSFAAGVGSTLIYLQVEQNEFGLAEAPLVEASKAPTRIRPEGLPENGPSPLATGPGAAGPSSLPSPISSAMAMPPPVPAIDLPTQGIPAAPEIDPPARAEMIEVAAPAPVAAAAVTPRVAEPTSAEVVPAALPVSPPPLLQPRGPETRIQIASLRTEEKAIEEMSRFKRVHAAVVADLEFKVERLDQGERGVFYRVLSSPVGERAAGLELCAALAERRGQCQVMTLRAPVVETRIARAPEAVSPAPIAMAAPPVEMTVTPPPAATEPERGEIRAQLATLRTFEGATRELNRLARVYGLLLERTELSVSRIDQGERGVFFRILTAPLPSRDAAGELCQRLGSGYQAGCVLIPQRPTV